MHIIKLFLKYVEHTCMYSDSAPTVQSVPPNATGACVYRYRITVSIAITTPYKYLAASLGNN